MKPVTPRIVLAAAVSILAGCGSTVPLAQQRGLNSAATGVGQPQGVGQLATGGQPGPAGPSVADGTGPSGAGAIGGASPAAAGPSAATGAAGGYSLPQGSGTAGRTTSGQTVGPIEVGFLYSFNDAAASAGINNHVSIDPGNVEHALVSSYNATGGFDGRHIEPVYAELKSSSSNYESDLQAVCTSFTQDNHVAAVISTLGYYSESFYSCLSHASVPVVSGDAGPDLTDARLFPLLATPDALLGDTRVVQVADRLAASGWLTTTDRIGVVIEGCPIDQRIFNDSLVPALRAEKLTVAATTEPECLQGIGDLGAVSGQLANAVLQFRSNGVTKVIFVSQAQEATIAYEFMLAAGNQQWYPGYALSSMAYANDVASQSGVSQRELSNARGVGWIPTMDSAQNAQPPSTPAAQQCLSRLHAQGLYPISTEDFFTAYTVCDTFALYAAVLHSTSGNSSGEAFLPGLQSVGSGFASALDLDGKATAWDHGRLSPGAGAYFQYVANRTEFVYTSAPFDF